MRFPRQDDAVDLKSSAGRNIQSIFKTEASSLPPYSKYTNIANNQTGSAANKVINGTEDVNTALRQAEELANKAIREAKVGGN